MITSAATQQAKPQRAVASPKTASSVKCLNLGCGSRTVSGWTNLDRKASGPGVIEHDLRRPLPFADASFDFVYSSHVLEHFSRADGESLVKESVRVLRPGGILRVVVPDMEHLARLYLRSLERAVAGEENAAPDYEWSFLMLYDQAVRSQPGGQMLQYLQQPRIPNPEFVLACSGSEMAPHLEATAKPARRGLRKLFSRQGRRAIWKRLLGTRYEMFAAGRFRCSGEIHQWMYDRYSLGELMRRCGLERVERRTADVSGLAGWERVHLDLDPDGHVYKPESLFMEGVKL